MKVCFGQDSRNFLALVSLNLDLTILHGAACATGALHQFSQLFFFGQTDPNKFIDHCNRFATTPCLDPQDVHPGLDVVWLVWLSAVFVCAFFGGRGVESFAGQSSERRLTKTWSAIRRNTFGIRHAIYLLSSSINSLPPSYAPRVFYARR